MVENTLPVRTTAEVRKFYYNMAYGIPDALRQCIKSGYRPLFVPEIADERIAAAGDDSIWELWWTTPSVRVTGRGTPSNMSQKDGTEFVVYAHVPNYFSDPENVMVAINNGPVKGAGIMPQEEFQKLLDTEGGGRVLSIGYSELMKWPDGVYGIDKPTEDHMKRFEGKIGGVDMIAINHPQTKPFLGPNAGRYLEKHKMAIGNDIGIWCSDDLSSSQNIHLGRVLVVGCGYLNKGPLGGAGDLKYNAGRFAGVRESAGGAARETYPSKV